MSRVPFPKKVPHLSDIRVKYFCDFSMGLQFGEQTEKLVPFANYFLAMSFSD
jgi:hypothetical protein